LAAKAACTGWRRIADWIELHSTKKTKIKIMNWIWFIIIGLVAGFLAGAVVKGHGFGIVGNLIVGVIGALLGGFVFGLLGISFGGLIGNLICAFLGAVLLLFLLGFVGRKGA
jgi:uncharacterized membrane protein YeaQ/YmgE (transglycosylase-associated protein family)